MQHLFGEAEVAAFPAVEQHGAQLVSGGHLPVARPAVDVAGNLSLARIGVGERELRKRDRLARVEHIRAGGGVRPRTDLDKVARITLHADVPRAGPAEDAADHAAGRLGGRRADGEHEARVVPEGVAHAAPGADRDGLAALDGRLAQLRLDAPLSRRVLEPECVREEREVHRKGIHAAKPHRALLAVLQLHPRLDHVARLESAEMLRDEERMDAVPLLQHEVRDARRVGDGPGLLAHEGEREVAVRVRHLQAAPFVEAVAVRAVAAVGRVGGRTPLLVLVAACPAVPREGRYVGHRLHPRAVVGHVPGTVLAAEGEGG